MTREAIPLLVRDLGTFTRALGRSLTERQTRKSEPPGHVELLNLLARAAGHRSYQGLRAAARLPAAAVAIDEAQALLLTPTARKTLTQFDDRGRLVRWPRKFSVQRLAMWVLWAQFDSKRAYTEREVNEVIKRWHTWGDHVTLRRELINHRLLTRKSDGSQYRKLPARPDDEARGLLRAWRERTRRGVDPSELTVRARAAAKQEGLDRSRP